MECPTCGQPSFRGTRDSLDQRALAMKSLFLQRGVELTKGEARVLAILRGKNRPISRNLIMDQMYWDRSDGEFPDDKIIDVWICKVKPKIQKAKLPWRVLTHWGLGYQLEEENPSKSLKRIACTLMILLPLGQVILSRLP